MPWSTIATNQCVSLNNLRDAIANGIFIAISSVPSGTKQITKTEALAYVDIQTSPLASKSSNQLVVKSNLTAKIYTYDRYDVDTTTCATSNPIPYWSYFNLPLALYNLNGTGSLYQLRPATHTNYTNQITSYVSTTCTPVTRYTYTTYYVNTSNCSLYNFEQWWSYNYYPDGLYYINGPGTLFSLSSSSHTNYTNQITSVSTGTCATQTIFYYIVTYAVSCNNCVYVSNYPSYVKSPQNVTAGYYSSDLDTQGGTFVYYFTPVTYDPNQYYSLQYIFGATTCNSKICKIYYFKNNHTSLSQTFYFTSCQGLSTQIIVPPNDTFTSCVSGTSVPGAGNRGDIPYTYDVTCCL